MEKNDSASASQFRLTRITDAGGRAGHLGAITCRGKTVPLAYDENGNLTQRQTAQGLVNYTWDARNRLTRIEGPNGSAAFKYDALENTRKYSKMSPIIMTPFCVLLQSHNRSR